MRLDTITDAVQTNIDDGEAKAFTIDVNGASFRVLFDTLYSDKAGAIIRELTCNAWDSHIAAGKTDVKVDVRIPNSLMPEFVIRDFGVGLSHEDMMELYRTVFRSKSRQSIFATGGLGLGSKSPLCYCDNFVAESFFNGEHRKYQVYLSEDVPNIMPLSCETTQEPNGLKVTIAVPEKDHQEFLQAAKRQLFLFMGKTTFEDLDGNLCDFTKDAAFIHEDRFIIANKVTGNAGYGNNRKSTELYAAMGNVLYKIDPALCNQSDASKGLKAILFFNIGEIDFAANRESLSYKERTIVAIQKRIAEAMEAIKEKFEEDRAVVLTLPNRERYYKCKKIEQLFSSSDNVIKLYAGNDGSKAYWNLEIEKIEKVLQSLHLNVIEYNQKNSWRYRSSRKWIAGQSYLSHFLEKFPHDDFTAILGTAVVTGPAYPSVCAASGLSTSAETFVYASQENWTKFMDYFDCSISFTKLEEAKAKQERGPVLSRKTYNTWIKGEMQDISLVKANFKRIFWNNEENHEPKEWMRVMSTLLNSAHLPFVWYEGRVRSQLESSFETLRFADWAVKANMKEMRFFDALYCKRFLYNEIHTILERLPQSRFAQEIRSMPMYDMIESPDDLYARLCAISIIPSSRYDTNYNRLVPEFLARYPLLRLIRADRRYLQNYFEDVEKLDKEALIDYIRLCEGEKNEVHHYDIFRCAARWERKQSKLVQDGTGREEGFESNREEGYEEADGDLQEAVSDVHREGIQEEEHSNQGREALLQGEGDSQLVDDVRDLVVSQEEAS